MTKNPIVINVGIALLACIGTFFITGALTKHEAGAEALDEAAIKRVMTSVLVLPDGRSYGAALAGFDIRLTTIETNQDHFKDEIDRIQRALEALAAE